MESKFYCACLSNPGLKSYLVLLDLLWVRDLWQQPLPTPSQLT